MAAVDWQTEKPDHILGLDLGRAQEFTALAVLERHREPDPRDARRPLSHYAVRYIQRWPLGTPYPAIALNLAGLVARPPLECPVLVIDQTGVGQAVAALFRPADLKARLRPTRISAGHTVSFVDGVWQVARQELASVLQTLLQGRRLKIAAVPEREVLAGELSAFQVRAPTAAADLVECWRERPHDDLVLAVGLACWLGEREGPILPPPSVPKFRRPTLEERFAAGHSPGARRLFGG
jgi:hypothetical protein